MIRDLTGAGFGAVHAVLHLSEGWDLRYVDQKKMGQVFATRQPPELSPIADFAGMGPEALEISREEFKARLTPFRGEIKGVLTARARERGPQSRSEALPLDCGLGANLHARKDSVP